MANTKVIESLLRETIDTLKEGSGGKATALEKEVENGKIAIAGAIENKGITTSPDKGLTELASDIERIQQESYSINGGEMYAKQLYGVPSNDVTPGYWNLYEVMAQLLSDGRFENYGGILLAEYYKGYDTLALSGAGAGGGYVTCDGDYYEEDVVHTWHDRDNGKGNRWVAYLFAAAGHNFEITDTNTSPRSIHIGRNVGMIRSLVDNRISEIVCTDGNTFAGLDGMYSSNFGKAVSLRNMSNLTTPPIFYNTSTAVELIYIHAASIILASGGIINSQVTGTIASAIIDCEHIDAYEILTNKEFIANLTIKSSYIKSALRKVGNTTKNLKSLILLGAEDCTLDISSNSSGVVLSYAYIGYKTNDKTKNVVLTYNGVNSTARFCEILELQDGWCKNLSVTAFSALTEANMYAHILQRLKQDEADCGDGVTITLGSTNLAKLTSAESVQLLDDLTNIYGYTFA